MTDPQWDYQEFKARMQQAGVQVADLVQLGRTVLQGVRTGKFIISVEPASSGELMQRRAERIGRGELPTVPTGSAFE
jgi:hypothetical protein